MGDRTTPMKFGPEWLRNMSREPTSPGSPGSGGGGQSTSIRLTSIATASSNTTTPPNPSKVLLAKLRYGREEMLALYDRQTVEAPPQLKSIEQLYQPRGKPPYALNNNFEDDTRDGNMRHNPPLGGVNPADRYGQGRGRGNPMTDGRGRAVPLIENRGRGATRGFVRQTSIGRATWNNGGHRVYPSVPPCDVPTPPRAVWNQGNALNPPGIRISSEHADWVNKTQYRKNRQNHTNWRQQQNRDEDEWRADGARRGQEKWDREWPERNSQEKPWTSNRRQWGGDNNEDNLPEWAVENAEACGGTFDSSGAFHGYSNDDTDLPKNQETAHPLTRSHTHGSFARSRTAEEGSEEWWASEKAKKLSAKRFDATEVKFKKHNTSGISEENVDDETASTSEETKDKSKQETINKSASPPTQDCLELQDEAAALPIRREQEHKHDDDKPQERYPTDFNETPQTSVQQRIDMLLRDEDLEASTEIGNYKSIMMSPNNNHLRQIHQNIGTPTDSPKRLSNLFESANQQGRQNRESGEENQKNEAELVEELLDMSLNEELHVQLLNTSTNGAGMPNQMASPGMQMKMNNHHLNQSLGMNQPNSTMPATPAMSQGSMMRPMGFTNSMLNASLGLPMGTGSNMGMPMTNMPPSPITNPGMLTSSHPGLGGGNMQNVMQGMQGGLQQPAGMQMGGMQSGIQGPGMQGNFQPGGAMPGSMQSGGMNNSNLQAGSGIPGFQGVGNNSLFMQGSNTMQNPNDMSIHGQQGLYSMHGLQQSPSQTFSAASMYGSMMQPHGNPIPGIPLTEQWYYEDPTKTVQGPFTSKDMFCWFRAGFFSPELMVRRACESGMRPLVNYGAIPFAPVDIMLPYSQMAARFDMRGPSLENNVINHAGLGPEVESLWSQPSANDMMWVQQPTNPHDDNNRVNNLSMYFWDQVRK